MLETSPRWQRLQTRKARRAHRCPACRGGRFAQGPGQDRRRRPPPPGRGRERSGGPQPARPGPAVRPHLAAPFLTSPPPSRSGGVYGAHGQAGCGREPLTRMVPLPRGRSPPGRRCHAPVRNASFAQKDLGRRSGSATLGCMVFGKFFTSLNLRFLISKTG